MQWSCTPRKIAILGYTIRKYKHNDITIEKNSVIEVLPWTKAMVILHHYVSLLEGTLIFDLCMVHFLIVPYHIFLEAHGQTYLDVSRLNRSSPRWCSHCRDSSISDDAAHHSSGAWANGGKTWEWSHSGGISGCSLTVNANLYWLLLKHRLSCVWAVGTNLDSHSPTFWGLGTEIIKSVSWGQELTSVGTIHLAWHGFVCKLYTEQLLNALQWIIHFTI